ncbi:spermine oxidase [Brachionus plicatilis]|uniref:Spermine oxidase n=1 Tax=Brachionus plicatilis TaxID=10195 RepID=A0A3M7P2H6_BRAPC|nr:spermine oxidase [Brachionus plicatilis]
MNYQVINVKSLIIGAGMAGVSASVNLLENNYKDFLVFEALERIGGRICTFNTDQGYLELGAQWIHGQQGNPIYEIAQKNDLVAPGFEKIIQNPVAPRIDEKNLCPPANNKSLLQSVNAKNDSDKTLFLTQTGHKISHEFANSVYTTLTKIILSAELLNIDPNTKVDNRVGDYFYDKFCEIVRNEMGKNLLDHDGQDLNDYDLKRLLNGLFIQRARRENIRNGCYNIFDVSLKNFSCYKEFAGHSYVELKKGFTPVLDALISKHKNDFYSRLYLRHFLKKIILSPELLDASDCYNRPSLHSTYAKTKQKAVVVICDASNPEKPRDFVVVCEHVLCTMSLGYMKENINNFLEPLSLVSEAKRLAVNRLGFGCTNKIFLIYEAPFWNENTDLLNLIWVPEDLNFRLDKLCHRNDTKKIWYEDMIKIEVVNSHPNTLSAWMAGNVEFEQLDEKTIGQRCTENLRRFFNDPSIPEPKSVLRTKWFTNRYSRGTYSHMPIGSKPEDFDEMARPIPSESYPIVMFAGEATVHDQFSNVNGAYLSGIRESQRILNFSRSSPRL